jgi:hypothetical protein
MGACVRWGMAVTYGRYEYVAVSLPKRFRNGRFNSETAVQRFQKRNGHLYPEVPSVWTLKNPLGLLEGSRYNSFSRRRRWAWLWKYSQNTPGVELEFNSVQYYRAPLCPLPLGEERRYREWEEGEGEGEGRRRVPQYR